MNWPNIITTFRLFISIAIFYLIATGEGYELDIAIGLLIIAGVSDFYDGYLARKYKLVTAFGRIADPFADKFLVIGSFIFLMERNLRGPEADFFYCHLGALAVFLIVAREFLVSSIRAYMESSGVEFGAAFAGKFKATWQFSAIGVYLAYMAHGGELIDNGETWQPHWQHIHWVGKFATWSTVIVTLLSAWPYIKKVSGKISGDM